MNNKILLKMMRLLGVTSLIVVMSSLSAYSFGQSPPLFPAPATSTSNEDTLDNLIREGSSLLASRNYTGANSVYDSALNIQPNNTDALIGKGVILARSGNYTGATSLYDKVLTVEQDNARALTNKGIVLSRIGNYTGAIELFDKALSTEPDYFKALLYKGAALTKSGDYSEAIEVYNRASDIRPERTDVPSLIEIASSRLNDNQTTTNAANITESEGSAGGLAGNQSTIAELNSTLHSTS